MVEFEGRYIMITNNCFACQMSNNFCSVCKLTSLPFQYMKSLDKLGHNEKSPSEKYIPYKGRFAGLISFSVYCFVLQ